MRGTHLGIEGVEHRTGTCVVIDGPADQEIYASGERIGLLPATVDVVPAALRVMVPTLPDCYGAPTVIVASIPAARWPGTSQ